MTLHRYFARRFLITFLATFAVFGTMLALLDMVEQIRSFDVARIGFFEVVHLTLLNVPQGLYGILPLITILASVILFLNLARSSELVIARAAGRSALRTLAAPVLVAAVLGALAVAGLNPIVAATQNSTRRCRTGIPGRSPRSCRWAAMRCGCGKDRARDRR